jgi:hypothetical protein
LEQHTIIAQGFLRACLKSGEEGESLVGMGSKEASRRRQIAIFQFSKWNKFSLPWLSLGPYNIKDLYVKSSIDFVYSAIEKEYSITGLCEKIPNIDFIGRNYYTANIGKSRAVFVTIGLFTP